MARHFYLTVIDGDGLTPQTAWRMRGARDGRWPVGRHDCVIRRAGAKCAFIEADTTTAEHNALVADAGIFHVPIPAALDDAMAANERNSAEAQILSRFGETVGIAAGTTWRQFLRALKRRIAPGSDIA